MIEDSCHIKLQSGSEANNKAILFQQLFAHAEPLRNVNKNCTKL